ncbi:MAG: GDSL-type esterase/lipase family protein [Salinivirgaceae bacterium]|jgi:acyl-CoA thioesterase-1|nr:GDSL-type esterase/lipase family protein [Salinivirgaceae bacterium]
MNKIYFLGLIIAISLSACKKEVVKIACVGDSITEGHGLAIQSKTGYPVVLDHILGPNYTVLNSGRSATNMQKKVDFPYWICKEFSNTFAFKPNIIVIKLGTNDTKPYNWNAVNYEKDYQALIDTFKTISTNPLIYLCTPAPVFKTVWGINDSTVINGVIPAIEKLAKHNQLSVIDIYTLMQDQGANFPDSIHPNEQAVEVMATIISKAIK